MTREARTERQAAIAMARSHASQVPIQRSRKRRNLLARAWLRIKALVLRTARRRPE